METQAVRQAKVTFVIENFALLRGGLEYGFDSFRASAFFEASDSGCF